MTSIENSLATLSSNPEPTVNTIKHEVTHLVTADLTTDRSAKLLIGLKGNIVFTPQAVLKLLQLQRKELNK